MSAVNNRNYLLSTPSFEEQFALEKPPKVDNWGDCPNPPVEDWRSSYRHPHIPSGNSYRIVPKVDNWDDCPNPPVEDWRTSYRNPHIPSGNSYRNVPNNSYLSYEAIRGHPNPNPESYRYSDFPQLSREDLYGYDDPVTTSTSTTSTGSTCGW